MRTTSLALLSLAVLATGRAASASFNVLNAPAWARPASDAAATATNTTFQEWDGFTSVDGASAPATSVNPISAASASDPTNATDGAFLIGAPRGDIYSFSGVIHPSAVIPGFGISGDTLNVVVQVQSWGTIDNAPGLLVNGVPASSLAGYSYTSQVTGSEDAGFGPSPFIDHQWTFTVADAASLQLDWTWGEESSALQDLAVDTQSVPGPVPEPASWGLLGAGVLLLVARRTGRGLLPRG